MSTKWVNRGFMPTRALCTQLLWNCGNVKRYHYIAVYGVIYEYRNHHLSYIKRKREQKRLNHINISPNQSITEPRTLAAKPNTKQERALVITDVQIDVFNFVLKQLIGNAFWHMFIETNT